MYVCVCVCVWERERERETEWGRVLAKITQINQGHSVFQARRWIIVCLRVSNTKSLKSFRLKFENPILKKSFYPFQTVFKNRTKKLSRKSFSSNIIRKRWSRSFSSLLDNSFKKSNASANEKIKAKLSSHLQKYRWHWVVELNFAFSKKWMAWPFWETKTSYCLNGARS